MSVTRRQWLARLAAGGAGAVLTRPGSAHPAETSPPTPATGTSPAPQEAPLALKDFQPKSMLHVPEEKVGRAKFPVIDVHSHLSWTARGDGGVFRGDAMKFLATPQELLEVMDRKNI